MHGILSIQLILHDQRIRWHVVTREDLWFEADRTRVLPVQHAEAVDRELAKVLIRHERGRESSRKGRGSGMNMELPGFIMDPIGDIFGSVEGIAFGILSVIAIGGAGYRLLKRVAHSMLALIMCFFAVAGVFLMANAEMLAAIQILVYLGSVMLVFASV